MIMLLCFLIALILFVVNAFWKPAAGPDLGSLASAFMVAGLMAAFGVRL